MSGFDFSKVNEKLGALPIWGWGLIIGGGIAGVYYLRKGTATVPSTSTTDTGAAAASSGVPTTSDNASISGYSGSPAAYTPDTYLTTTPSLTADNTGGVIVPDNGYVTATPSISVDTGNAASNANQAMPGNLPTTTTPTTSSGNVANTLDAWRQAAIVAAGVNSKLSNTYNVTAIDKYLAGQPLTTTQAAHVQKALSALGQAPGTSLAVKIGQTTAAVATTPKAAATSAPANATTTPKAPVTYVSGSAGTGNVLGPAVPTAGTGAVAGPAVPTWQQQATAANQSTYTYLKSLGL